MVVARRDFDADQFDPAADLISLMHDLTIIAMIGIVDPPRAEAKAAIAKCHSAGIEVRMITGDHAVTAAAIGKELGIDGRALTGAEFAALTDEELAAQLPEIGVVARVAPEDKIRLVHSLQQQSNIVAMTGDGVNDAPALKKADIGVAMGITGTEVSKDAAVMILTDDNFATIVRAVEYGRELYDNLSKYIRFQMAALVGLHRHLPRRGHLLDRRRHPVLAAGRPLDQLRRAGADRHRPRVRQAPARASWTASPDRSPSRCSTRRSGCGPSRSACSWRSPPSGCATCSRSWADALVATTMAVTVFSLMNVAIGLSARSETRTIFTRDIISDRRQLTLYGGTLLAIVLATELDVLNRILDTTSLTGGQWLVCLLLAAGLDRGRGDHQARPAPARARHPRRRSMTPDAADDNPDQRRRILADLRVAPGHPRRPRRPADPVVRRRRVRVALEEGAQRRRQGRPPARHQAAERRAGAPVGQRHPARCSWCSRRWTRPARTRPSST